MDNNFSAGNTSPTKVSGLQFATPPQKFISWLPIVLVMGGIVILSGALIFKYLTSPKIESATENAPEKSKVLSTETTLLAKTIKVDISGAVEKPGVYEIPDNYRVTDVLITAGGITPKADRNYVSKNINLAQKLSDGQKIYIPFEGETTSNSVTQSTSNTVANGTVNINMASLSELDKLPGIGPVTAQKIIDSRPYLKNDDLLAKKIVSKSVYDKIKDQIATF